MLLANIPTQAESLLHRLEQAAGSIDLHVNADKTKHMLFNKKKKKGDEIVMDEFTYLSSCVSSAENDINKRLAKAWTSIDRLSIIWKSILSDKGQRDFFQVVVVSILMYGCTTWILPMLMEKKLEGSCKRMLQAVLNKSWKQHATKQ